MGKILNFFRKYVCCCFFKDTFADEFTSAPNREEFTSFSESNRFPPKNSKASSEALKEWLHRNQQNEFIPKNSNTTDKFFKLSCNISLFPVQTVITIFSDYDSQLETVSLLHSFRSPFIAQPQKVHTVTDFDADGREVLMLQYSVRQRLICSLDWLINAHKTISKKPLSTAFIAFTLKCIINALQYAHKNGYVFKNFTSSCVFFTDNGEIIIIPPSLLPIGTFFKLRDAYSAAALPWTPPEVILARKEIDSSANIYALGIIACQLGFLSVPYYNLEPLEMLAHKCKNEFPPLPLERKVSSSLMKFIFNCIHHEPSKRVSLQELEDSVFIKTHYKEHPGVCDLVLGLLKTTSR